MNHPNHPFTGAHVHQEALGPMTTATHYPLAQHPNQGHKPQMVDHGAEESSGAFAETLLKMDEEFYRMFPAARSSVVPTSMQWSYDRSSGQFIHSSETPYRIVRDSDYPPCFQKDFDTYTPSASSLNYDYLPRPSVPPAPAPSLRSSHLDAKMSAPTAPVYNVQQATIQNAPHFDSTGSVSAVEDVPPHLIVPSQQPIFDFRPEIRRQQQWGREIEMYDPYPRATPDTERSYSGYPASPPTSDPLSPTSPMSPTTPVHPLADWSRNPQAHCYAHSGLPVEYEDGTLSWQPYPSSGRRSIVPAPYSKPLSPGSGHVHHGHLRRHRSLIPAYPRHPSPPRSYHSGIHYDRASSHRLRGSPGYMSRLRRSQSPRMDLYANSMCSPERGPSPVPLSPLSDQKKPIEKKIPNMACLFCRGRKIACGAPSPDSKDRTCSQCLRRSLKCEYPQESRRGMRKKKVSPSTEDSKDEESAPTDPISDTPADVDDAAASHDDADSPSGTVEADLQQPEDENKSSLLSEEEA